MLTAVDAAVMVIDAAKGVEAQTIKLLEVCRLRDTPIITFVNKMDREVREPLALLEEIESVLKIDCAPMTWPIGMGKRFRGVFHLLHDRLHALHAGRGASAATTASSSRGSTTRGSTSCFPARCAALRHDVELIRGASACRSICDAFLAGRQTPVFFGSAINNFGVQEILQALRRLGAAAAAARRRARAMVQPAEAPFTGFVFKIQANMDPRHRDRIAFFRVCSGRYQPA